jgi:zinc protease
MNKKLTEGLIQFEGNAYTASLLPRRGSGVVVLKGAIHAGPWHEELKKESAAGITASLLDEGTKFHSRESFRTSLEEEGIKVYFWAEDRYAFFSITATAKALPRALALTFEALSSPLLSEASVTEVIEREAANLLHDSESTRSEARRAFSRLIFKEGSAGYLVSADEERKHMRGLTRTDILSFISANYRGRIVLAAVGDVEASELERMINKNTSRWDHTHGASSRSVAITESPEKPNSLFISIPGKESVDVYMGSAFPMMPTDPAFPALRVATDILGGGFSDHLMQTIRDRDGLTYGTYARLSGKENGSGVSFGIWAMFGNALFHKGMKAIQDELEVFLKIGITSERLKEKVEEVEGRSAVIFSDHRSALYEILSGMLSVADPRSADTYISKLRELDADSVKKAAEKYLRIDAIAAAGAIDGNGKLL